MLNATKNSLQRPHNISSGDLRNDKMGTAPLLIYASSSLTSLPIPACRADRYRKHSDHGAYNHAYDKAEHSPHAPLTLPDISSSSFWCSVLHILLERIMFRFVVQCLHNPLLPACPVQNLHLCVLFFISLHPPFLSRPHPKRI